MLLIRLMPTCHEAFGGGGNTRRQRQRGPQRTYRICRQSFGFHRSVSLGALLLHLYRIVCKRGNSKAGKCRASYGQDGLTHTVDSWGFIVLRTAVDSISVRLVISRQICICQLVVLSLIALPLSAAGDPQHERLPLYPTQESAAKNLSQLLRAVFLSRVCPHLCVRVRVCTFVYTVSVSLCVRPSKSSIYGRCHVSYTTEESSPR